MRFQPFPGVEHVIASMVSFFAPSLSLNTVYKPRFVKRQNEKNSSCAFEKRLSVMTIPSMAVALTMLLMSSVLIQCKYLE